MFGNQVQCRLRCNDRTVIAQHQQSVTCGLRISDSSTSDNLTPLETTKQTALRWVLMGLVCPVLVAVW